MKQSAPVTFIAVLMLIMAVIAPAGTQSPLTTQSAASIFAHSNLLAWCIVPYDGKQRTPEQRAQMLERIGLHRFAYDWRDRHLPTFDAELTSLDEHHIELVGVWFPDTLKPQGRYILDLLAKHHVKTQLWVTNGSIRPGSDTNRGVEEGAAIIGPIAREADKIGCTIGLYNHGGWFGEPLNEIAILERLKTEGIKNIGIVYNQHHGPGDGDRFPMLLDRMKPYLLAINLNGMMKDGNKRGEKVLPVGQGDMDLQLLRAIRDSGYAGPVGLINETDQDAELRLLDNLDGLDRLVAQLDGKPVEPAIKLRTER